MLHEETVEASTLALIRRLMADENLSDFYLVGGTALSLRLGHRISIDIDLCTGKDFDSAAVCEHL
ncbi:Nucleotidyl transferase AbiEii toxin, Type IV TA system [Dyadobacter soli]|uniref:Nucleotidyl transferase AbiEii toxin, Type IV TA system n=1 Tax=Dyadobacter soli TaxID=659014 RepID=A0A1G8BTI5_9BACT|nr:Nucleotidyl transferase AbiEii toxin, Type IV TA system [Dyadobacter soli]